MFIPLQPSSRLTMVECDLSVGINPRLQPLGALDPNTILVDERTLVDRLSFSARFAELIVFFDQNNQPNGNWRQFFLKDPLILMAAISTTEVTPKHHLFLLLQKKLQRKDSDVNGCYANLTARPPGHKTLQHLAQLFKLINALFADVNAWLEQMDIGHKSYALRTFVQQQVQNTQALQLGQLIELQKLCHIAFADEIPAPDFAALADFNPLWQRTMQTHSLTLLDIDVLERVVQIYHQVFGFYVQVVDSAKDSFNALRDNLSQSDSYADTALLIAFAHLMQVQQDQLNQLTETHLNFYYRDILQQKPRPAEGDSTIVCLILKPDAEPLRLPQGTRFDGGVDAQQQPQQFVSQQAQWFNQIQIEQVQTLRYEQGKLFANVIKDADKVVKDPQGQLRSWPLLGEDSGSLLRQGLAVASPLLSLSAGKRTITLIIRWVKQKANTWTVTEDDIKDSQFYLSTEKAWLAVVPAEDKVKIGATSLTLVIELSPTDPAIVPFAKNPDGYASDWPLFKWLLSERLDLTHPPQLSKLEIDVVVNDFHAVELYNDDGKLSADSAFMPFGPIPAKDSRFYLGSAEIFAKPLSELKLQVNWDKLPGNMREYYQIYNQYLDGNLSITSTGPIIPVQGLFENLGFKGTFSLFKDLKWQAVEVINTVPSKIGSADETGQNVQVALFNNQAVVAPALPRLAPASLFSFTKAGLKNNYTPDPNLLLTPLDFFRGLNPGFIQLQLSTPDQGFGFDLYAQVVTAITQENAYRLMEAIKKLPGSDTLKEVVEGVSHSVEKAGGKVVDAIEGVNHSVEKAGGKVVDAIEVVKEQGGKDPLPKQAVAQKTSALQVIKGVSHSVEEAGGKVIDAIKGVSHSVEVAGGKVIDAIEGVVKVVKEQSGAPDLLPLPNLPYALKISALSLCYHAGDELDTNDNTKPAYPCELFHYDSFSAYSVYRDGKKLAVARQSPDVTSNSDKPTLVPGVASGGCLYLALNHIQPPCNLSLYFQLNHLVGFDATKKSQQDAISLRFYALADNGWRALQILSDTTDSLRCSGIIEVLLPQDMSQDPTVLPFAKPADATTGKRGWLAILGSEDIRDYAQVVYLNTQALQVTRQFQLPWTQSEAPTLAADSIAELVVVDPAVDSIGQPFAASGGQSKESQHSFYRRVSERIDNKDRVVAQDDLAILAYQQMPDLYYCKVIRMKNYKKIIYKNCKIISTKTYEVIGIKKYKVIRMKTCKMIRTKKRQPMIQLMLVNGYQQPEADAFEPVVNACQLKTLQQFFARRISPMLRFKAINPDYQTVKVTATLSFVANVAVEKVCLEITEQLKIYLSPWIDSKLAQRNIDTPLTSGELIDFLTRRHEVAEVDTLKVKVAKDELTSPFEVKLPTPHSLLVSAPTHCIKQMRAT